MGGVRTQTLAEIYARQGHFAEACEIYEALLQGCPEDEGLKERLAQLQVAWEGQRGDDLRRDRVDRLRSLLQRVRARRQAS